MRILIFDTETSGTNPAENVILQLSYQIVESSDWSVQKKVNHYFPWPEEKWKVSPRAIEVNGLTQDFLSKQILSDKKSALEEFVADKDSVNLLVAHNLDFDKHFVVAECRSMGVKYANSGWNNTYDTMKKTTNICCLDKYYGWGYKYPKLIELAQFLGVKSDDLKLHDSSADVELTTRCLKSLIENGYYQPEKKDTGISVVMNVESADDITYSFLSEDGKELSEIFVELQYGKKAIRDTKQELIRLWVEQNEKERNDLKQIFSSVKEIKEIQDFTSELNELKPEVYNRSEFTEQKPDRQALETALAEEAKQNVSSILFWTNASKRRAYVNERIEERWSKLVAEYESKRDAFNLQEDEKEKTFNEKAHETYMCRKTILEGLIAGDKEIIEKIMREEDVWNYPLEIIVTPTVISSEAISLDVTLPDIDAIPHLFGARLSSGKYKIKNLSDKEKREDYAMCVTNLAFYLAASILDAAPTITQIEIKGSQIIKETGDVQTIYSIMMTREQIKALLGQEFVGYEKFADFPHNINMTKTFLFHPIK